MPRLLAGANQHSTRIRQLCAAWETQVHGGFKRHDHTDGVFVGRFKPIANQLPRPVNLLDSLRNNFKDKLAQFEGDSPHFGIVICQKFQELWTMGKM